MTHAGEERINRALKWSALGFVLAGTIGTGAYFISKIPRARPISAAASPGPGDVQSQRAALAASLPPITFTDVAGSAGVSCICVTGAQGGKLLPETMGGGVAIFDADLDGRPDIAFATGSNFSGKPFESQPRESPSTVRLFMNRTEVGSSNLKFEEAVASGLDSQIYGMGLAAGDYDGDGLLDLFVSGVGRNELFRNESGAGAVRFRSVTDQSRVDPRGATPRWGTSAGFFDGDRDGDLDLLVVNYVRWSPAIDRAVDFQLVGIGRAYGPPTGFEGDDLLYMRNRGDGSFEDATVEAGFARQGSLGVPIGKGLGLAFIDPDQDGDLDVVVANDTVAKCYFVNDGTGNFTELAAQSGLAFDRNGSATGAMGIDSGYLRTIAPSGEGDLAIAIGNFANEPDGLYVSRGNSRLFSDDAVVEGLAAPTRAVLTFGLVMEDFDLDGDIDIAQANGHIEEQIGRIQPSQSYAQRGQLFVNSGGAPPCLVELPAQSIGDLALQRVGRALASGDLDGDGDADLVMTQSGAPAAVLRNDTVRKGHWIRFDLRPSGGGAAAVGAQVDITTGSRIQRRIVSPTRSYLSQCQSQPTFGLGDAIQVDSVTIRWPNGQVQKLTGVAADRVVVVEQGKIPATQ